MPRPIPVPHHFIECCGSQHPPGIPIPQSICPGHLTQAPFLETRISIQNSLQKSLKIPTYFLLTHLSYPTPCLHHRTTTIFHTPQNDILGPLHSPSTSHTRPCKRAKTPSSPLALAPIWAASTSTRASSQLGQANSDLTRAPYRKSASWARWRRCRRRKSR